MTSSPAEDFLPIVTLVEEEVGLPPQRREEAAAGGYEEDFQAPQWVRRIVPKREEVGLNKLSGQLDEVQNQVEKILQSLSSKDPSPGKMRLAGLQVCLGITAQGSIGVVTAGMQASLTLVYER